MPGYSQDVLEDLRQGNDIIDVVSQYVQLRQAGASHVGLCPFHREKSPSFSVSSQKQLFHCFGCGAAGNVFSFVMKIENFGFMDAVKFLADRINYHLPPPSGQSSAGVAEKSQMYDIYRLAARYYYDMLQEPAGRAMAAYLDSRRISPGARRKFGLGAAASSGLRDFLAAKGCDDGLLVKAGLILEGKNGYYDRFRNRLMFPIFDVSGKVISFGGRIVGDGHPKYMNSPETPIFDKSRTLYGLNYARLAKSDSLILVEGYMDVIAMHQAGVKNAVAALGTAFTANHARIVKRYCKQAIVLFDGDEAGVKATQRAAWFLYSAGVAPRIATLKGAKDPDEYLVSFGAHNLTERLAEAEDFIEFQIQASRNKYNLDITADKVNFIRECTEIISRLNTAIEREAYVRDVSAKYDMDQQAVKEGIGKHDAFDGKINIVRPRPAAPSRGYHDAMSHILYCMSQNEVLCDNITAFLSAEEMVLPLYTKLYQAIVAARQRGSEVVPADVVAALDNTQEQQEAAAVFAQVLEYENMDEQYAALAQQIKLVKTTYLQKLIDQTDQNSEFEKINSLAIELRRLKAQKISL